jgi:hypothetical protein
MPIILARSGGSQFEVKPTQSNSLPYLQNTPHKTGLGKSGSSGRAGTAPAEQAWDPEVKPKEKKEKKKKKVGFGSGVWILPFIRPNHIYWVTCNILRLL